MEIILSKSTCTTKGLIETTTFQSSPQSIPKLKPFFSARLNPNGENQTHIGGTFDFKDTVEIGGGYKSIGYSNVMLIVKTKFGLTAAYAYDFGIPSGQEAVTRSGNEIFLKFKF